MRANRKACQWKNIKFKSMFERDIAKTLEDAGYQWEYEPLAIEWQPPISKYIPDFRIWGGPESIPQKEAVLVEAKGLLTVDDRRKMLCVKEQYPDLDIRFLFMNKNKKIYPRSKTTYLDWAEEYDYDLFDLDVRQSKRDKNKKASSGTGSKPRTGRAKQSDKKVSRASQSGA